MTIPLVDVDELLATPEAWRGREVRVYGFATIGFEDLGLYASRNDREEHSSHSICLFADGIAEPPYYLNNNICRKQPIVIQGTFDPDVRGHFGGFAAGLSAIKRARWASSDEQYRFK